MASMHPPLTQQRLKEILRYDEETGLFFRKVASAQSVRVGDVAGSLKKDGYIFISVDGRIYRAHRLAWLYIHGEWPKNELDHIDCVRSNNRISNLRDVDRITNSTNARVGRINGTSGLLGVSWDRVNKKWVAQITSGGKNKKIGRFEKKEDAYSAYLSEKRRLHSGCVI